MLCPPASFMPTHEPPTSCLGSCCCHPGVRHSGIHMPPGGPPGGVLECLPLTKGEWPFFLLHDTALRHSECGISVSGSDQWHLIPGGGLPKASSWGTHTHPTWLVTSPTGHSLSSSTLPCPPHPQALNAFNFPYPFHPICCCCCCSDTKTCLTVCNPMDCSMPAFLVLHCLRVCSDPCPLSGWCHPTISSSVVPFSSCLQSFQASGSFKISQLFTSGGQNIRASASASVLPMNIQGWFLLGLTGLISLLFKGLSRVFSSTTIQKHQFFSAQPSLWFNSHIHTWLLEKP